MQKFICPKIQLSTELNDKFPVFLAFVKQQNKVIILDPVVYVLKEVRSDTVD